MHRHTKLCIRTVCACQTISRFEACDKHIDPITCSALM